MELTRRRDEAAPTTTAPVEAGRSSSIREGLRGQSFQSQQLQLKPKEQKRDLSIMQNIALSQDPNDRERALLEDDADAASAWVRAAAWALGISGAYAQTSGDSSSSMYLGKADALRHCLWNGYMAYMLGEERAKQLADAHELPGKLADRNTAMDREMDLHNNAMGRILGVTARESNVVTRTFALGMIAAAALAFLNDGTLKIIDRSDPNNWQLVPSNREGIA